MLQVQYSTTVQYSTVQYSTVQYSTVQYSTVQYSTVQYYNNTLTKSRLRITEYKSCSVIFEESDFPLHDLRCKEFYST